MNRPIKATILACVALLVGGCSAESAETAETVESEPETIQSEVPEFVAQVADVARAIGQNPAAADSILEAHQMTRSQLDSLMFEIAMDSALTEAYEEARR